MGSSISLGSGEVKTGQRCRDCRAFEFVKDGTVYRKKVLADETLRDRLVSDIKNTPETSDDVYLSEWDIGGDTTPVFRYDFATVSRLYIIGRRVIVLEPTESEYSLPSSIPVDFVDLIGSLIPHLQMGKGLESCPVCANVATVKLPHCNHRMCVECMENLFKEYWESQKRWELNGYWGHNGAFVFSAPELKCPKCRQVFSVDDVLPLSKVAIQPGDVRLDLIPSILRDIERQHRVKLENCKANTRPHGAPGPDRRSDSNRRSQSRPSVPFPSPSDTPRGGRRLRRGIGRDYMRTMPSRQGLIRVSFAVESVEVCAKCNRRKSIVRYRCGHKLRCLECHNASVRNNGGTMPPMQCSRQNCPRRSLPLIDAFLDNFVDDLIGMAF